jgi:ComF family protein
MSLKSFKDKGLSFYKNIKEIGIECLFPTKCLNCHAAGEILCDDCFSVIEIIDQKYCHICNKRKPLDVFKCSSHCRSHLFHLFFATIYNKDPLIQALIHRFKYPPLIKKLDLVLAKIILVHFELIGVKPDFFADFIVIPVPLYFKKNRARGFNQSAQIAKRISTELKIIFNLHIVKRIKNTQPQIKLMTKEEKKDNVADAFKCVNSNFIKNKNVLLIDDVYTTGSTMEECAKVLKKAGAKRVFGCVIAITNF